MNTKLIRNFLLLLCFLILGCVEKVIYIEIPIDDISDDIITPYVTSSIVNSSTQYQNEIPYVSANGRITNYGPGIINNVRLLVTTNHGYSRITYCSPSTLNEEQSGNWSVSSIEGTYIKNRTIMFE